MNKFDLAKYIISNISDVSPMKLQKLLYYVYAWSLAVNGSPLYPCEFRAWKFGPVDRDIYDTYRAYGRVAIPVSGKQDVISVSNKELVDFVLKSYGHLSSVELSKTTHNEDPWKDNISTGSVIDDAELISFYRKMHFFKNFPLGECDRYYPPTTSADYNYSFDNKTLYLPDYPSIDAYLLGLENAKRHMFFELRQGNA